MMMDDFTLCIESQECYDKYIEERCKVCIERIQRRNTSAICLRISCRGKENNESRCVQFLEALDRSIVFQQQISKRIKTIICFDFFLDDWKPLIGNNPKGHPPLNKIDFESCHLTERGARILGSLLDDDDSNNENGAEDGNSNRIIQWKIQELSLRELTGSNAWIPGLYRNTSIQRLRLWRLCFWHGALYFLLLGKATKLIRADFLDLTEEPNEKPHHVNHDALALLGLLYDSSETNSHTIITNYDVSLYVYIDLGNRPKTNKMLSHRLCTAFQNVFRSVRLDRLILESSHRLPLEYSLLPQCAIHCRDLTLRSTMNFDPLGLAALINRNDDGCLERLCLILYLGANGCVKKIATLLKQADLTRLNFLSIFDISPPVMLDALCHQLGQNMGPRHLHMGWPEESHENFCKKAFLQLMTSLQGNTRIKHLNLYASESEIDPISSCDLLHVLETIDTMPSLSRVYIGVHVDPVDPNDVETYKGMLVRQKLKMSSNLSTISLPLIDHETEDLLHEIGKYMKLLRTNVNELPDGIWPLALGGLCNMEEARADARLYDVMYFLVREMPRLFQPVMTMQEPSFSVPHHPNCPACHKRQRNYGNKQDECVTLK